MSANDDVVTWGTANPRPSATTDTSGNHDPNARTNNPVPAPRSRTVRPGRKYGATAARHAGNPGNEISRATRYEAASTAS
ncbi:hypothetical protein [Lentzea sp. E54]|uniref:hypothetical protein n=1 Tax=Lentzea xerophila TaxID=3435883 RepID=UPI003DA4BC3F